MNQHTAEDARGECGGGGRPYRRSIEGESISSKERYCVRGVWMMLRALQEPSSNGKTRAQVGANTAAVEAREGGSGRCGDGEKIRTGIVFVAMAQ